ncbi:EthD family reductase [Tahibacter amnicola]|uniref:EthD family reductase n=1 Tax=Tahibacter amnicola TaxID=2976241 RepID=A0ABY6BBB3_9GAMM|nr:EthD family reductase [Tahibacter amnicola]UXI66826.1 EthD family reductase [Tahibacter amnicola]
MIRVSGFYRWRDGARFDHADYAGRHMAMARELLQPFGLTRLESDRRLSAAAPASGEIVAASHAYFATVEDAQNAVVKAGASLLADAANYTDLVPEICLFAVSDHAD